MKRLLALMMILLLAIICCACGDDKPEATESEAASALADGGELTVVTLVPSVDSVSGIDADALNNARTVIEARLKAAQIDGYSVSADEDTKQITVMYPKDEAQYVSKKLLTQVGKLSICDPEGNAVMDNGDVEDAFASVDTSSGEDDVQCVIVLSFTEEAKERFKELTEKCINKQTAVYIDDKLICSPTIQAPITDGVAQIVGDMTAEEAQDAACLISVSSLPFPLRVVNSTDGGADAA